VAFFSGPNQGRRVTSKAGFVGKVIVEICFSDGYRESFGFGKKFFQAHASAIYLPKDE
jgi:hypothetical protein